MDALETLVREALAEHAHEAPRGLTVPDGRGPRRWPYAVLAAAVVAAVAVGVVIVRGGSHSAAPAAPTFAPIPAGMNEVSYHGITLQVPDNVPIGPAAACQSDGVHAYDPHAPHVFCANMHTPNQGLLVELSPYRRGATGAGDTRLPPHRALDLPGPGVHVYVRAPTKAQVDAVLASVRVTPVDRNGCTATMKPLHNPPASTLLHGHPTTAGECIYTYDGPTSAFLLQSLFVDPGRVGRLVEAIHALPGGAGERDTGFPHITRYVFDFADGSTRTIEVDFGHPPTVTDGQHVAHDPDNSIAQAFD